MKKCTACYGENEDGATTCKWCNHTFAHRQTDPSTKWIFIALGVLAILWPAYSIYRFNNPKSSKPAKAERVDSSTSARPPSTSKGSKASASVYCEQAVKSRLRAPKTAEFAGSWLTKTEFVKDLGRGKFEMRSYVDAQNGFGAMVRNNFVCEIHFTSRDAHKIVELDIH